MGLKLSYLCLCINFVGPALLHDEVARIVDSRMYVYVGVCACMCVCVCVYVYVSISARVYVYVYVYVHHTIIYLFFYDFLAVDEVNVVFRLEVNDNGQVFNSHCKRRGL